MSGKDPENPYAGQGSVLLDIGGEIGALVVHMPRGTTGMEVEIRPRGGSDPTVGHQHHRDGHDHGHDHHPHVAVVERPTSETVIPSLVFPELVEGEYELYEKGTTGVVITATVRGGEVTSADWPG